MKKKLIILNLLFTLGSIQSQSWDYYGNPGFSAGAANEISFDILESGEIFLALQELDNEGKLDLFLKNNGIPVWASVTGDAGFSSGNSIGIDLNLESDGSPFFSFIDTTLDTIEFGHLDNSNSLVTTNPSNGGDIDGHSVNSITRENSDGLVYICSYHSSWNIVVYRANSMGGNFSIFHPYGVLGDNSISQLSFDIKFNSGYIAYSNLEDGGKIDILNFQGQTMDVTDTWDNISDGLSNYFKIAINPLTLQPYIAYQDIANNGALTVKKLNGSSEWELVGEVGFSQGLVNYVDLDFDVNGNPFVVFQDVNFSNKLSVMTYNSGTWDYVGERGITESTASHCEIKLNSNGEIFVGFKDGSQDNKASVMRYGSTLSLNDITDENIILYPNPTNDKIYFEGIENYYLEIYNNLGQKILDYEKVNSIDISSLSKGVYFIKFSDGVNSSTKKFIKN